MAIKCEWEREGAKGKREQVYRRVERERKSDCFVQELDLEFGFGFVLLGAKPGGLSLSVSLYKYLGQFAVVSFICIYLFFLPFFVFLIPIAFLMKLLMQQHM